MYNNKRTVRKLVGAAVVMGFTVRGLRLNLEECEKNNNKSYCVKIRSRIISVFIAMTLLTYPSPYT